MAAAIQAAHEGLSHIFLERAEIANTIYKYSKGKHVMAEPSAVLLHERLAMQFEATARETVLERWAGNLAAAGVNMERSPGCELMSVSGKKGEFRLHLKDGRVLEAGFILLAIGTSGNPRRFNVPGEDQPYLQFHLPDPSMYVDKQCIVAGVGDAGIEDALSLARFDNDVAVINTFEGFPLAKAANRGAIEAAIASGEIKEYTFTTVERFEPNGVWLNTRDEPFYNFPAPPPSPGGDFFVECDLLVARIGALPPREFLEDMGIEFEGPNREAMPRISDRCETTVPGIYLAGALAGRPLIKHAMNQGFEVIQHMLGKPVSCAEMPLLRERLANIETPIEEIVDRIRTVPIFSSLSRMQVEELLVHSRVHVLEPDDVVYEAGDFSNTFYAILDGAVGITEAALDYDLEPVADEYSEVQPEFRTLGPDEFFGTESMLSGRPRVMSAIVQGDGPCTLVEVEQGAMYRLIRRIADVKRAIDQAAIVNKIAALFPMLPNKELEGMARDVEIESFPPGGVLFSEGDASNGLHIIRRGSVVVTRTREKQSVVINHLRAGDILGEIALVRPDMKRTATVKATVLTETLRLPAALLTRITQRHPELRIEFERRARLQAVRDERVLANPGTAQMADFLITKGGKEATDLLVIDESLCIRCDNCEKACGETHGGVSRLSREDGPRQAGVHLPTACQHCENPFCMKDCPPNALRRDPSGEIYILDTCIGCGNCAGFCPYGVIKMKPVSAPKRSNLLLSLLFGWRSSTQAIDSGDGHELAVKCDLCREVPGVAEGYRNVACVSSCPTGAIVRLHPVDLVEDLFHHARGDDRCPSCGRHT
jgi:Fe-S-cluster-containing dehydrogenase component/thioredoxin reductase